MNERKEDAVSPVVGVMLMLVVTIIIAAVVSGFAGGLASVKEKAPQAFFECRISENSMGGAYGYEFVLKHLSGDPINTHNLKLVTSWVDASGTFHVQDTVAPTWVNTPEEYRSTGETCNYSVSSLNTNYDFGTNITYQEPYKVIPADMPADGAGDEETLWFGNYIMRAGDVAKSIMNIGPSNLRTDATIIADWEKLTGNEVITVKLIDLKSQTTIFSKDIVVGA